MKRDVQHLGDFTLDTTDGTSKLRISDPCYKKGTPGTGVLDTVGGRWNAWIVKNNEGRVTELFAFSAAVDVGWETVLDDMHWEQSDIVAGVDSGQCGMYDDARYPTDEKEFEYDHKAGNHYGRACKLTIKEKPTGQVDNIPAEMTGGILADALGRKYGAVSCSGYGDGGYPVYTSKMAMDKGRDALEWVFAVRIVYIDSADEDEAL